MPTRLHVEYTDPFTGPAVKFAARWLPKCMQQRVLWGRQAPTSRPLDVFEVFQEDPYEIHCLQEDKVWRVQYHYGGIDPEEYKVLGMRADKETHTKVLAAAALQGAGVAAQAELDWQQWLDYAAADPSEGRAGGYCRRARHFLNMFVVKLNGGSLLLFSPVVIHPGTQLAKWVAALGPVEYIVIGSCHHTNYLPEVVAQFPAAVVIGPPSAEGKLNVVNALPRGKLDFNYLIPEDVASVNALLGPQGATLHVVHGECFSQAAMLLAHDTLLEVDMVAGHTKCCQCTMCRSLELAHSPAYAILRVFLWACFQAPNSPHGYLPAYRFAALDPKSPFSALSWPPPAPDGGSCRAIVAALRAILKLPFHNVGNVHQLGTMSRREFEANLDAAWRWLDGETLLPSAA